MHLIFGMMADGSAYPDFPGDNPGCFDGCIVGPLGLLEILETRLGLGGPPVTPVVRITAWQKKLKQACHGRKPFYAASLEADPFSTARLILSWRDALVEAGWTPTSVADAETHPRLADMAAAEAAGDPMPPGRADRLRAVIARLESGGRAAIGRIETVEAPEDLPPGWRRLTDLLSAEGTEVRKKMIQSPVMTSSDLGRLHVFLQHGTLDTLDGDASVIQMESAAELSAAEAVAEWIAAEPEGTDSKTVVIAQDGSTALIDLALARLGRPALGVSAASPFRGALQVLTLAFATVWKPFDAERFLALLTLPNPPIRRKAASYLARAVSKEPGIKGPEWNRAWDKIKAWIAEETGEDKRKAKKLLADIEAWTDVARFEETMPAIDAKAITDRVRSWANTMSAADRDPLLMCVVGAAKALSEALTKLDETPVSRRQIEQMIDAAIAEGLGNPAHRPQASNLRAISHPGALCGPLHRVVWWNFAGHEPASPPFPWYRAELDALEAAGCCPEKPSEAAKRQTEYWANAALAARESILFVRPAVIAGVEAGSHPFSHMLAPLFDLDAQRDRITIRAEELHENDTVLIAARTINRRKDDAKVLPGKRASWPLPPLAGRLAETVESPTSLETLSECHLKWLLEHVARLGAGRIRGIPDANRLFGNIAHMIAQEVFVAGPSPSGAQARQHAERIFDRVVEQIAAPLLKPGGASDLAFARERIPKALGTLADIMSSEGWIIVGTETEVEHDFGNGLKIKGRTDLRVMHPVHDDGVIDLKWSRSDSRRRNEIKDGRAVQISAYGHAIKPGKTVPAAYFMLAQGSMLAEEGSPLARDPVRTSRDLAATWDAVVAMHRSWSDMAASGTASAAGVKGAPVPAGIVMAPSKEPCTYCNHQGLCRVDVKQPY